MNHKSRPPSSQLSSLTRAVPILLASLHARNNALDKFHPRARCACSLVGRTCIRKPACSSRTFARSSRKASGCRGGWRRCHDHLYWRSDHLRIQSTSIPSASCAFGLAWYHFDHHPWLRQQLQLEQRAQRWWFLQWCPVLALCYTFCLGRRRLRHLYVRCACSCCRCSPLTCFDTGFNTSLATFTVTVADLHLAFDTVEHHILAQSIAP